jgi:enamine deaminase RidA (YjgF/YER057c/UK114 family)
LIWINPAPRRTIGASITVPPVATPAAAAFGVAQIPTGACVEIEMIAEV